MCRLWSRANYAEMQIRHESRWVWQVLAVVVAFVICGFSWKLLTLIHCFSRSPGSQECCFFLMPTLVQVNWIISIFICHFPFGETTTTTTNWIDCCQTRVSVSLCPGGEYTHLWLSFNVSTPSSLRGGYTTETGTETGEPWDARLLTPRQARLMQLKCVCLSQSRRYK